MLNGIKDEWFALPYFVSCMLDAFERCLVDAALSGNVLSEAERQLLSRMNKVGIAMQKLRHKRLQASSSGLRVWPEVF